MSHRGNCVSMLTKAVLTDPAVAFRTDILPPSLGSELLKSYVVDSGTWCPLHVSNSFCTMLFREASIVALSPLPSFSHAARVNALNVDPVWKPAEPPRLASTL